MKKLGIFILVLNSLIDLHAQEEFSISKPDLSFSDNILTIKYDIYGGSSVFVNISLIVLNSKGDTIKPRSISGSLGKGVGCGTGKIIKWNIENDNISMNDSISVSILGEKYISPVGVTESGYSHPLTRGKVIIYSFLVPGLGQVKASGNKSFYTITGLAYGCLGAALYFNFKAGQYQEDYESSIVRDESDKLYNKWQKNYNLSKYLTIGAAGIWVADLVWAALIPIDQNNMKKLHVSISSFNKGGAVLCATLNF